MSIESKGEGNNEMTNIEMDKIIRRYNITTIVQDGATNLSVGGSIAKHPEDIATIRASKSQIINRIEEIEREKAETEAHTVKFYVTGWEAHKVSIDDRKDLDKQFIEISDHYSNDGITTDSVRKDYEKYLADTTVKIEKEVESLESFITENDGKELMTEAEYKVWSKNYNDLHNGGGEGYIPYMATQEDLKSAKDRLAKIKK